jgi:hypothetical protein
VEVTLSDGSKKTFANFFSMRAGVCLVSFSGGGGLGVRGNTRARACEVVIVVVLVVAEVVVKRACIGPCVCL